MGIDEYQKKGIWGSLIFPRNGRVIHEKEESVTALQAPCCVFGGDIS
jgi:hypothetical protein